jgi:hypothetical protein
MCLASTAINCYEAWQLRRKRIEMLQHVMEMAELVKEMRVKLGIDEVQQVTIHA